MTTSKEFDAFVDKVLTYKPPKEKTKPTQKQKKRLKNRPSRRKAS